MNTATSSSPDLLDELLADLVLRMDKAAEPERLLEDFCGQHPEHAAEARRRTRLETELKLSRPAPAVEHPVRLGDFKIVRQMARGGMGVIYEAVQERLKRRVVVKTMRTGLAEGPGRVRFLREQEALARLHQTHIVPIHTADEAAGLQYFVMPYIEGASLNHIVDVARQTDSIPGSDSTSLSAMAARWLDNRNQRGIAEPDGPTSRGPTETEQRPADIRTLPPSYFRSVAMAVADVAEGLHHAHQAGFLHRDVKPSNLMIEPSGKCWIIDFGLAALAQQGEAEGALGGGEADRSLTRGDAVGTPAYMAPEQWRKDGTLDARTDVWGLGATLYELLTLHRPFSTPADGATMTQREDIRSQNDEVSPRSPSQYLRKMPDDLEAICLKALERDPAKRYASALEMAEDLRHWLRREPTRALPGRVRTMRLWARRNTGWASALTLLVAGTIALVVGQGVLNVKKEEALRESQRQRKREELILRQQQLRLGQHELGWSSAAWNALQAISNSGHDSTLRDHLAATFTGYDAEMVRHFKQGASSVAYDAAGKRLLIGGYPGVRTKIWDGTVSPPEPVGPALSGAVAFTPEGIPVQAALKSNWTVEFWDLAAHKVLHTFNVDSPRNVDIAATELVPGVNLSGDGDYVALMTVSAGGGGLLVVWDTRTGKPLLEHRGRVTSVAFTSRGRSTVVAAGTAEGEVRLWQLPEAKEVGTLKVSANRVEALAFGHDPLRAEKPAPSPLTGWLLAIGTNAAEVSVWRPATSERVQRYRGSQHNIISLAFNPDGTTLVSGGRSTLHWWDVATGRLILFCRQHPDYFVDYLTAFAFSPDGRHLAFANLSPDKEKRGVTVVHLVNGRGIALLRGLDSSIQEVRLSPKGRLVAALSQSWQVGIWDYETGRLLHVLPVPSGYLTDHAGIAFSPDGKQFACCTGTKARLWDVQTGRLLRKWDDLPPGLQNRLAFHLNGMLFSVRSETVDAKYPPNSDAPSEHNPRVVRVRNLLGNRPKEPLHEFHTYNLHVSHCEISPDGHFLAVHGLGGTRADRDHRFDLYDLVSGKRVWGTEPPFSNPNRGPSFSFDSGGRTLTVSSEPDGNTISLLDLKELKLCRLLQVPYAVVHPRLSYYAADRGPDNDENARLDGVGLYSIDGFSAHVRLGIDYSLCTAIRFSPNGNEVIYGVTTGELVVADLNEINRRLHLVNLGW